MLLSKKKNSLKIF